jgi:cytochrome c-type biogenesis protein CcmH/NrfG
MLKVNLLPIWALAALSFAPNTSFAADLSRPSDLYRHADYANALRLLLASPDLDAQGWALAGKSSLMLGDLKQAGDCFDKATALAPRNSEYALWFARTWGKKAEAANPFSAGMYAAHARDWFEKAVALDPRNVDAIGDLLEYYLEAPALLGGGLNKAESAAERLRDIDPAEYRFALARLAAKRQQASAAEENYRAAVNLAPKNLDFRIALARFLAEHGRFEEASGLLAEAESVAPGNPRCLYGRAAVYIGCHRNLTEARSLLQRYLSARLSPDDPSREDAKKLLRQAA